MKPITCPCGLEKDFANGITQCRHCDTAVCKGPTGGCNLCSRYEAITSYRTRIEYAQEQKRG